MSDESTAHDNNADSRPRIQCTAESPDGFVEVTVHGAEGESVDDVAEVADGRLDHALRAQSELSDDGSDGDGVNIQ